MYTADHTPSHYHLVRQTGENYKIDLDTGLPLRVSRKKKVKYSIPKSLIKCYNNHIFITKSQKQLTGLDIMRLNWHFFNHPDLKNEKKFNSLRRTQQEYLFAQKYSKHAL